MMHGPMMLSEWMRRHALSQREAATRFGWDDTYVSRLCTGARRPGLKHAVRIQQITGIAIEAWVDAGSETVDEGD